MYLSSHEIFFFSSVIIVYNWIQIVNESSRSISVFFLFFVNHNDDDNENFYEIDIVLW